MFATGSVGDGGLLGLVEVDGDVLLTTGGVGRGGVGAPVPLDGAVPVDEAVAVPVAGETIGTQLEAIGTL